ncbi:MAG: hypothetical protein AVDCRST_MAG41-4121, partial [uncultured Corynebacteriales bacterium]
DRTVDGDGPGRRERAGPGGDRAGGGDLHGGAGARGRARGPGRARRLAGRRGAGQRDRRL